MDALPVREAIGLDYASAATATDPSDVEVHAMHPCGEGDRIWSAGDINGSPHSHIRWHVNATAQPAPADKPSTKGAVCGQPEQELPLVPASTSDGGGEGSRHEIN